MNAKTRISGGGAVAGPTHPDLAALRADGAPSPETLDAFLAGREVPLAEPGALTFLWRGEAREVELLRWIHAGIDATPFVRLPGTDLWHLRLPVEDRGRFEYKIKVVRDEGESWDLDPLNPHRAADPFGENSVAMSHGYARPDWSVPGGAPEGELRELDVDSAIFGHVRRERIYLPAGYDENRPYPLVVIHDGGDYDDYAELTTSLDNLIEAGDVPPLIALLIQAGDRMDEYPRGRRHARYVVQELLPALEARHAVSERAGDRVLMGASLGAVASLATAFRFPGAFGGLILKSGSFILDPEKLRHRTHPVFDRVERLVRAIERAPDLPPTRAFVSTGELEGLADENRALAEALRARGMEVRFQSSWDGHHWHNWRDQLRDALMWVLREDA
jgi:enterochelin esterase family protein